MKQYDLYTLNYWDNFKNVMANHYFDFSGRTGRGSYWRFIFFYYILGNLLETLIVLFASSIGSLIWVLYVLFGLAIVIPSISITVRRLHDVGKSGWYIFLGLIPIIGALWVLYYEVSAGDDETNEYGEPVNTLIITPEIAKETGLAVSPSKNLDIAVLICMVLSWFLPYIVAGIMS